jgi:hypothetical protein
LYLQEVERIRKEIDEPDADIEQLLDELGQAEGQLVQVPSETWVDNTLIPVLIEEADAIDTELYTEESVEALQEAVTEAQSVLDNADATQEEVDAAEASLLEALEGLQEKDKEDKKDITASLDPAEPNGKNGWYTSPVTVTLSPADMAEYSLDDGDTWTSYSEPVILDEDGEHQVLYRSTEEPDDVKSLEFKIDLTPPQVDFIGQSMYTIDQEIMITCEATDVTSGVHGTPCDQPLLHIMAYELEPGEHTVTVEVEDMAGNLQIAQWTFVIEATYDTLAVLSERVVTEMGAPGARGIANSLKQKLSNAKRSFERGNYKAAQDQLQSYIEQVEELAGNKLSEDQADMLIRLAKWIHDTMPLE